MKDFSKENNLLTLNVSLGQKRSIDSFSSPPTPTSTSSKKGRISKNKFDMSKIESSSSAPPPRTQTLERAACAIDQYKSEDDEQKDQSKCQLFYGMKYDPIFVNQYVNLLRVERLGGDNYDTDIDWAFRSDDDDDDDNDSCYSYFSSDDEDDDYTKILCKNTTSHLSSSNSSNFKSDLAINIGSLSIDGQEQNANSIFRSPNSHDKSASIIDNTRIFRRS